MLEMCTLWIFSWISVMVLVYADDSRDCVCDYKISVPKTISWNNPISQLKNNYNRSDLGESWDRVYMKQVLKERGYNLEPCEATQKEHFRKNESSCFYILNDQVLIKSVAEQIVKELKWPNVVVLFDKNTESAASQLSSLQSTYMKMLMYQITNDMSVATLDKILVSSSNVLPPAHRNFLVLCHSDCIWKIISQVNSYDEKTVAIQSLSKWIFAVPTKEIANFERKYIKLDHVAIFTFPDALSGQMNLIIHTNRSCAFGRISTLLYKEEGRAASTVGSFDMFGQISLEHHLFPNIRFGFNKRKFLAATIVWSPFVIETKDSQGKIVYEGICMDLLYQMAISLNFTYEVIETPDKEFGAFVNNSWTGLVGLLQTKKVDLVVGPLTVTKEREMVMDFIYPFYHDYGKGIFRTPDPAKSKWKTLLRPFRWEVIASLGGAFVFSAMFLYVTQKLMLHVQTGSMASKELFFQDSVWYTYATYVKHYARFVHISGCSKVFVSFLWFFSTIVIAAYSGSLVAFLTVKKTSPPFRTLAEVSRQDEYKWGTVGGSMWVTLFTRSNLTVYQDIWRGIQRFKNRDEDVVSTSDEVHKRKVINGNYIFFFDGDIIMLWSEANCDLEMLDETFYQIQYAVGLPNMSPYNKLFSDTMLAIEQSGLLDIWKKRWWPKKNVCLGDQLEARVIDIVDVQSAFYVMCIGVFVGFVILLFEKWRQRL